MKRIFSLKSKKMSKIIMVKKLMFRMELVKKKQSKTTKLNAKYFKEANT
jgi:hypothetical protein